MTDRNPIEIYTGDRDDSVKLPRASAAQKITGGMRAEDIFGRCPPDTFDGFEEAIRAMRRGFAPEEPHS
jgi:hypothetical protein